MFITITFVICLVLAYSMGMTSNGMTSPRQAFNLFTAPFTGILGAIIGLFTALLAGGFGYHIGQGFLAGLVAGLIGLVAARLQR